jgi:hypothetical protein
MAGAACAVSSDRGALSLGCSEVRVSLPCGMGRPKGHLVAETKLRAKVALRPSMGLMFRKPQET